MGLRKVHAIVLAEYRKELERAIAEREVSR
jgi:hypothetical protein